MLGARARAQTLAPSRPARRARRRHPHRSPRRSRSLRAEPCPGAPTPPPITVAPEARRSPSALGRRLPSARRSRRSTAIVATRRLPASRSIQSTQRLIVFGKAPGATVVTVTDARGIAPRRAGSRRLFRGQHRADVTLALTGDPASPISFAIRWRAPSRRSAARPGAQIVVASDDVPFHGARPRRRRVVRRSGSRSRQRRFRSRRHDARRGSQCRGAAHFARLADGERLSGAFDRERNALYGRFASDAAVALSLLSLQPSGTTESAHRAARRKSLARTRRSCS